MPNWKIDTLDPRGGLAFATWRKDTLSTGSLGDDDDPCIFVSAPGFRVEPVTTRSMALGAGHGAFQMGFFRTGDVEVGFPEPGAVAEFVRRTYIRSGAGDGNDSGPSPGPLPQRPSSDEYRWPGDSLKNLKSDPQLRNLIVDTLYMFRELIDKTSDDQASPFNGWPRFKTAPAPGAPQMLASAAVRLIYELFARRPDQSEDVPRLLAWQRDAQRLRDICTRLDLWPILLGDPYRPALDVLGRHMAAVSFPPDVFYDLINNGSSRWPLVTLFFLLIQCEPVDDVPALQQAITRMRWWRGEFGSASYSGTPHETDPMAALWKIPLPEEVIDKVNPALRDKANLYHALAAFIASPHKVLDEPDDIVDLVLFASACIVGPPDARPLALAGWSWRGAPGNSSAAHSAADLLALRAWNWLREHLPRYAFPAFVEDAIASASGLRYRA